MRGATAIAHETNTITRSSDLPEFFLNCYAISHPSRLAWSVRTYDVVRKDGQRQPHKDRGKIRDVIWKLRKQHASRCRGFGFVIDIGERIVAVPANWDLPSSVQIDDFEVTRKEDFITNAFEPRDNPIVAGIIREAVKNHLKKNQSEELGILWQDFNQFCQMPNNGEEKDYLSCRRFGIAAKVLRGNQWVLELLISTATLDGKSFADYYRQGEVGVLADMIEAKRANQRTRQNRPPEVRVWRDQSTAYRIDISVPNLYDPEVLLGHATLSHQEQISLANGSVRCRPFNGSAVDASLNEVRLVLDTQITQEEHSDTIIEPEERESLARQLRNLINGIDAYGNVIHLADTPVDVSVFPALSIPPPAVRVKSEDGRETIVAAPETVQGYKLKERARKREEHIRRYGFLQQRPINPLLALPKHLKDRARRMKSDLNSLWKRQGIDFEFEYFLFNDVEHLRKKIERDGHDALFAVLPEGSRRAHRSDDTHEKIKQRIEIPSQCIQYNNTLPETWVNKSLREFRAVEPRLFRRIQQRYELCLSNLLVKHNWVPFAPEEAFHYNVHIGLDVGGQHNNTAMACLGHGLQRPIDGLFFRPEEIPIDVQQAEPIPTDCLYQGLLNLFEYAHAELPSFDFERALFFRDGQLLGNGDEWNEQDALTQLHTELRNRGWISEDSVWTAVEILKNAEGWRLLHSHEKVTNPLVGQCLFPFDDENVGLVCTTGAPYLSQGTGCPLLIRIINIYGRSERSEVVRDLVWEADMCFTKTDMGLRLPWVLHVADTGALQRSRSYRVTGITV